MKIIHLTDLHLTENRNTTLFNVNTYDNFDFVCAEISRIQTLMKIELMVVSGDIASDGDVNAYIYFLTKMNGLNTPYFAIAGNHDVENHFNIALAEVKAENIITTHEYNADDWYITSVDTPVSGEDHGYITQENLAALEEKLATHSNKNIALFMHHHPVPVGTPIVDNCMLTNASALLEICKKHTVRFIGSGHAHTPRTWHSNALTISVAPAISSQWLAGTKSVKISKGMGFNIIELSSDVAITSCIY